MAENISAERNGNKKHSRKKSTRVDLTPMVDLGFLLITFFVFTTAMTTPKAMTMVSPKEGVDLNDKICESCAITFIPGANNKLYYYEGAPENAVNKLTDYSAAGIRALLVKKKKEAAALNREAVLIIKPGDSASFKNIVNIIDESNITMYKRYYLADEAKMKDDR